MGRLANKIAMVVGAGQSPGETLGNGRATALLFATEGAKVVPLSEIKSGFPILKNPANRHRAVGFTPKQWHYVFANTFGEEKSLELYERYHIPASGRVFWGSALANIHPGKDDTYVDYHNDARPPLLFISGKQDHLFPPKVGHSNARHYKSKTVTEIVEFDGPHLLPAIDGWGEVADLHSIGR